MFRSRRCRRSIKNIRFQVRANRLQCFRQLQKVFRCRQAAHVDRDGVVFVIISLRECFDAAKQPTLIATC